MDPTTVSFAVGASLFALLIFGVWIGLALMGVGLIAIAAFTPVDPGLTLGPTMWSVINSWTLTSLPMFIWMGEILTRSRLGEWMFQGLAPWVQRIPGKLLHVNVFGSGIFAAICGSSAATAATIGRITLPELRRRGYDDFMLVGSLSGSGTLGLLIPPSITMIVYGVAAEVSIARLFMAGVVPGIVLMLLFALVVGVWAKVKRGSVPDENDIPFGWKARLQGAVKLVPVVLLIMFVVGTIYTGVATPTEAAVIGVAGALFLSVVSGGFGWKEFTGSVAGAVRTNCMIGLILAGAAFMATAMGFTQLPAYFAAQVSGLQLSPAVLIIILTFIFIIMGCFLDGISMVLLTATVILPTVHAAGIDLLWFGIFIVLVVEMSQVTPPVGLNLFVLQGLSGRSLGYVATATLPFFFMLILTVVLIWNIPEMVSWLPNQMFSR